MCTYTYNYTMRLIYERRMMLKGKGPLKRIQTKQQKTSEQPPCSAPCWSQWWPRPPHTWLAWQHRFNNISAYTYIYIYIIYIECTVMLMSFSCYMPLILPAVIKPPTTQQTLSSSKKVIRFIIPIILCRCVPIYFQTFRFEYKIPGAIEIWKWSPHQHASNTRDDRQEIPPQRDLDRFEGVEATTRHRKGLHSFWTALDNHRKAH